MSLLSFYGSVVTILFFGILITFYLDTSLYYSIIKLIDSGIDPELSVTVSNKDSEGLSDSYLCHDILSILTSSYGSSFLQFATTVSTFNPQSSLVTSNLGIWQYLITASAERRLSLPSTAHNLTSITLAADIIVALAAAMVKNNSNMDTSLTQPHHRVYASIDLSNKAHIHAIQSCVVNVILPSTSLVPSLFIAAKIIDVSADILYYRKSTTTTSQKQSIVVIGGGPSGLLSALEAYRHSSTKTSVTILEQRNGKYSRSQWIDVSENIPEVLWKKIYILFSLYGDILPVSEELHMTTLRIHILERILSKLAIGIGVIILYGHEFITTCDDHSYVLVRIVDKSKDLSNKLVSTEERQLLCSDLDRQTLFPSNWDTAFLFLPADLIIAADGASGTVSKIMNVPIEVPLLPHVPFIPMQVAIVISLLPIATGRCLESIDNGDAFRIGFQESRVSAVFKRLYKGYCSIQILLKNSVSKDIINDNSANFMKKSLIFFDSSTQMSDLSLQKNDHWSTTIPSNIHPILFNVLTILFKKNVTTLSDVDILVPPLSPPFLLTINVSRVTSPLLLLSSSSTPFVHLLFVGDAAVTSVFRLGIGVNKMVYSLYYIRQLLISESPDTSTSYDVFVNTITSLQLSTIYYETYCNITIIFPFNECYNDLDKAYSYFECIHTKKKGYERVTEDGTYRLIDLFYMNALCSSTLQAGL